MYWSDTSSHARIRLLAFLLATTVLCGLPPSAQSEDSVPALKQALAELPADTSVLQIPEGLYTIGSTWVISKPGITIRGAGSGKTIFMRDPNFNGVLVKMDGEGSVLSSLTLDGNGTATVVSLSGAGVTADALDVKNFTRIGIAVPATGCRVTKCTITAIRNPTPSSMGIWHDAGRGPTDATILIDHNTIKHNGLNGIYCTGGSVKIEGNQLSHNHIIWSTGGGQIDVGNAFTTNTDAVISGNTVVDGGGIKTGGLELGGGKFTVTGNIIRNHGSGGIGIGHNVIGATITGNTISNCGQNVNDRNTPQNRSGIYVGYGATNVIIARNRCFDDQPNKSQTYGVIFAPPPRRADPRFAPRATEHVVVKENDLRGNVHGEGLLDQSGARDRIISANLKSQVR
jgi:Right handed beta helix region